MEKIVYNIFFSILFITIILIPLSVAAQSGDASPADCQSGIPIADFESGKPTTLFSGVVDTWEKDIPRISMELDRGGTNGSKYALKIPIRVNDGDGPDNWTGGGMSLTIKPEGAPIDISQCMLLAFDIKIQEGSVLHATQIKIEDANTVSGNRPERLISEFGITLSNQWQTVRIPLREFRRRSGDPGWWRSLQPDKITRVLTISKHDSLIQNGDGVLFIDNIHFEEQ